MQNSSTTVLSKSKIIAFRQCPKRLWLEVNRPELLEVSLATQSSFSTGNQVGEIARLLYDTQQNGILIDIKKEGFSQALARSHMLTQSEVPIFEAGFSSEGLIAFADVMLPLKINGKHVWKMVEVKSSTAVRDYHLDDVAVQSYIAKQSGFVLNSVSLAHIDTSWVYPGKGAYEGLLKEVDVTDAALGRSDEVSRWIEAARQTLAGDEPAVAPGEHCTTPYDCGFYTYCTGEIKQATYPIHWLPRLSSTGKKLAEMGIDDMRDVPDEMLNETQLKVKQHTLSNTVYFDVESTKALLEAQPFPAYFLDFETINFAIPIWAGTRPYQQVPFQYSLHVRTQFGEYKHYEFLDISGDDPSRRFAEQLVQQVGEEGSIYVYNAGFEGARLAELAARFEDLSDQLIRIKERLFDLLPLAKEHYYHPSQQGSWSIKKVLPALVPSLSYDELDGVKEGGMAMDAFTEAIHPNTPTERKQTLEKQLLAYCQLDTWAMVKLFEAFSGRVE